MDIDLATPGLARIVGSDPRLDTIAHGLYFGEGPVWDHRNKRFLWTDIIGDTIWQWRCATHRWTIAGLRQPCWRRRARSARAC